MPRSSSARSSFLVGTVGAPISTPPRPGGSPGAIARIAELGLGALELGWVQSVRVTEATCDRIRDTAAQHGIALSVHAPYFINFNAKEDRVLEGSRQRLMNAARAGARAGATDIIFHPGGYMGDEPADVYPVVRDRLRDLRSMLDDEGIQVTLRPETTGRGAMFGTLEECCRLAADIPGVQPCIDFAHLHARRGDGSFNSHEEFDAALMLVNRLLGKAALRSLHIHLSGIEYGPKGERNHLPLDEADLRYLELLDVLKEHCASGRVMCESPILENDALKLQALLRA